ncbi:hypothetical protein HYX70_04830 [Candidatus Saccharibacteria bacterium]|nr:hypothetical protein [Candidatus Saccharibacteria bacterium]
MPKSNTVEETHVEQMNLRAYARMLFISAAAVVVVATTIWFLATIGQNLGGSRDYVSCKGRWPAAVKITTSNGNATLLARQHFKELPEQVVAQAILSLNPQGIRADGGAWLPAECNGRPPTGA